MKPNYPKTNLTELTDEQLDVLLRENGQPFSEIHQQAIQKKLKKKRKGMKRSTKIILGVAATMFLLPTSVYAANKVWSILMQQDNFLTTVKIQKENANQHPYKLNFTYVPSGLVPHSGGMKYWHEATQSDGFSSMLLRPKDIEEYNIPFSTGVEETEINGNKTFFVKRSIVGTDFDTVAFMICEAENLVVQVYLANSLSQEEQEKILAGIKLEGTTEEQSMIVPDVQEDGGVPIHIEGLRQNSKNIYQLNEPIRLTHSASEIDLEIQVQHYSEGTTLPDFSKTPSSYHLPDNYSLILTPEGSLLPYTAKIYQAGDGVRSLDEQIKEKTVQPLYKEMTFTIRNLSTQTLKDYYFSPTWEQLQLKKSRYQPKQANTFTEPFLPLNEPVYIEGAQNGHDFYRLEDIAPNETRVIRIGYLDVFPEADDEFIQINSDGTYVEDFNTSTIQWIQLPKNK